MCWAVRATIIRTKIFGYTLTTSGAKNLDPSRDNQVYYRRIETIIFCQPQTILERHTSIVWQQEELWAYGIKGSNGLLVKSLATIGTSFRSYGWEGLKYYIKKGDLLLTVMSYVTGYRGRKRISGRIHQYAQNGTQMV